MEYTKNVFGTILRFFKNLKHLSIVSSSINDYPSLSLYYLPRMTLASSTLTKLVINVNSFTDIRALLDGRLKQLTTFIVEVFSIDNRLSRSYNKVSLCFVLLLFTN